LRELVKTGQLQVVEGFALSGIARTDEGLVVSSVDRTLPRVDEIIAATGFRPDLDMLREVRLDLDAIVESPRALAPLIDPNVLAAARCRRMAPGSCSIPNVISMSSA
jgi:hypothetical protein